MTHYSFGRNDRALRFAIVYFINMLISFTINSQIDASIYPDDLPVLVMYLQYIHT